MKRDRNRKPAEPTYLPGQKYSDRRGRIFVIDEGGAMRFTGRVMTPPEVAPEPEPPAELLKLIKQKRQEKDEKRCWGLPFLKGKGLITS